MAEVDKSCTIWALGDDKKALSSIQSSIQYSNEEMFSSALQTQSTFTSRSAEAMSIVVGVAEGRIEFKAFAKKTLSNSLSECASKAHFLNSITDRSILGLIILEAILTH